MRVPVRIRCVESVTERIEAVYDRITQRAHEQGLGTTASRPPFSDSWTVASRELLFEPETDIREWGHGITVDVDCAAVDPSKIRLFVSSKELLVLAPLNKPGSDQWLFRHLRFETELDGLESTAEFERSILRIRVTKLNAPDDEKIRFYVA